MQSYPLSAGEAVLRWSHSRPASQSNGRFYQSSILIAIALGVQTSSQIRQLMHSWAASTTCCHFDSARHCVGQAAMQSAQAVQSRGSMSGNSACGMPRRKRGCQEEQWKGSAGPRVLTPPGFAMSLPRCTTYCGARRSTRTISLSLRANTLFMANAGCDQIVIRSLTCRVGSTSLARPSSW